MDGLSFKFETDDSKFKGFSYQNTKIELSIVKSVVRLAWFYTGGKDYSLSVAAVVRC
jgi:hypothetical protein